MKIKFILLLCPALFLLTMCDLLRLDKRSNKPHQITYMIMAGDAEEEKQSEILIKSIRKFGGIYAQEPVILVCSRQDYTPSKEISGDVQKIVKLEIDESLASFPFSDKVFACAQVESMVKDSTDWLMWLNPDAIVFAPPEAINSGSDKWVSVRSVHHSNIGIEYNSTLNEYWRKIYLKAGVDTNSLWPVESFVDKKLLRPYYNSGCMAFRPEKAILQSWKKLYCSMLNDKETHDYYLSHTDWAIYFHQAVLSSVIIANAGKERINILPDSYSYPLVLQELKGFSNKLESIPGINVILCGNYERLKSLRIAEPYKSWLQSNVTDLSD